MTVLVLEKPKLDVDQMVSASDAAKQFGKLRRKAKEKAQFILENNRIDSVLMNYEEYEQFYMALDAMEEFVFELEAARRLKEAEENPTIWLTSEEVWGKTEHDEILQIDPDSTPDEDLFE